MKDAKPYTLKTTRRRRAIWWAAFLLLTLAGGTAGWYFFIRPGSSQAPARARATPQSYASPVIRGDLRVSASGSGKLVAYKTVDMRFPTSGTVREVNVKMGDTVQAGQVLASLGNSETLEADLAAAKLDLLTAEQALTELQENADLNLAQAYSDLVAAQETYHSAEETSQRMAYARCGENTTVRLAASLERAATQLANIRSEKANSDVYTAAKEAYDTALANYNACAAYDSDEKNSAASELEVARAALQEAQDSYDTLTAAEGIEPNALAVANANLKMAEAQLANAEEALTGITITAPIDGKVTYLAGSAGAMAGTETFITLVDISRAALEISVNEGDMGRLKVGAPVIVTFDALPNQSFTGTVTLVNPEVTVSGQYFVVKGQVELDESAAKTMLALPLGLSASVILDPQEALDALLAPVVSLQKQADGSYAVLVQSSDGRMQMRAVTVGIRDTDYAEITSGLEEGEMVSTGSVQFIAAGSTTSSNALKNAQDAGGPPQPPSGGGGLPPGMP